MLKKLKNIVTKIDIFLYRKFGSEKKLYFLENFKEAKLIFSYINYKEEESRIKFVGGCVRKALLGEYIDDIDLATSFEPIDIKKKLSDKNIKIIDTGISHGTITAILNKKKFEITTLREDAITDGRHADVEFTSNWKKDSSRRDFTINAIYSDINGNVFDPQNGEEDLKNGIVKFIGDPAQRIQEDYLRILRYFRFFIQYSKQEHENKIINLIKTNINGLNKIANERIFEELKKIFKLKNIDNLLTDEETKKIFFHIFPQIKYYNRLKKLKNLSEKIKNKIDEILILALLIIDKTDNHQYFCHKYKTSNKIKNRFLNIANNFNEIENIDIFNKKIIKKYLYYSNKEFTEDLLLFAYFINDKAKILDLEEAFHYLIKCEKPKFPITGKILEKEGYESGKVLGEKLKKLENIWISNNFHLDDVEINKFLKK
jgi:tRNA nucleotidyltransferase/poly(A) polymerase